MHRLVCLNLKKKINTKKQVIQDLIKEKVDISKTATDVLHRISRETRTDNAYIQDLYFEMIKVSIEAEQRIKRIEETIEKENLESLPQLEKEKDLSFQQNFDGGEKNIGNLDYESKLIKQHLANLFNHLLAMQSMLLYRKCSKHNFLYREDSKIGGLYFAPKPLFLKTFKNKKKIVIGTDKETLFFLTRKTSSKDSWLKSLCIKRTFPTKLFSKKLYVNLLFSAGKSFKSLELDLKFKDVKYYNQNVNREIATLTYKTFRPYEEVFEKNLFLLGCLSGLTSMFCEGKATLDVLSKMLIQVYQILAEKDDGVLIFNIFFQKYCSFLSSADLNKLILEPELQINHVYGSLVDFSQARFPSEKTCIRSLDNRAKAFNKKGQVLFSLFIDR